MLLLFTGSRGISVLLGGLLTYLISSLNRFTVLPLPNKLG
jgi:hypothetical protein